MKNKNPNYQINLDLPYSFREEVRETIENILIRLKKHDEILDVNINLGKIEKPKFDDTS